KSAPTSVRLSACPFALFFKAALPDSFCLLLLLLSLSLSFLSLSLSLCPSVPLLSLYLSLCTPALRVASAPAGAWPPLWIHFTTFCSVRCRREGRCVRLLDRLPLLLSLALSLFISLFISLPLS